MFTKTQGNSSRTLCLRHNKSPSKNKKTLDLIQTREISQAVKRWCHSALLLALTFTCNVTWAKETTSCKVSTILPIEERISFHPTQLIYWQSILVSNNTNLMLFDRDADGEIIPLLAKSWQADKLNRKLKIQLNESCHWSDGHPITAQDMKSGIQRLYQGPPSLTVERVSIAGSHAVLTGKAGVDALKIHAVNEHTLEIEYEGALDLFLLTLSQPAFTPKPTHLKTFAHGEKLPLVSSGAYVTQYQDASRIVLKKNPYFCQLTQGNVDEVEILTNLPMRAEVGALSNGKVDILLDEPFRSLHTLDARQANHQVNINFLHVRDEFTTHYLMVNQRNDTLRDPRIRKAIELAIEHGYMRSSAIFGSDIEMATSYAPQYGSYRGIHYAFDSAPYSERLKKAQALMREAGYSKDRPLKLDFPSQKHNVLESAAEALVGMLKGAYIQLELRYPEDLTQYYANLRHGTYDLAFMSWSDDIPDPSNALKPILSLISASAKVERELKQQLVNSHHIQDKEQRYLVLKGIEETLKRVGSIIPLYRSASYWVVQSDIEAMNLRKGVFRGLRKRSCLSITHNLNQHAPPT